MEITAYLGTGKNLADCDVKSLLDELRRLTFAFERRFRTPTNPIDNYHAARAALLKTLEKEVHRRSARAKLSLARMKMTGVSGFAAAGTAEVRRQEDMARRRGGERVGLLTFGGAHQEARKPRAGVRSRVPTAT